MEIIRGIQLQEECVQLRLGNDVVDAWGRGRSWNSGRNTGCRFVALDVDLEQ